MKELKRLFTRKTIHKRVLSSLLAMLLVITSVVHPINMVPAYATGDWLDVDYQKQDKNDLELYVQTESASFEPGETVVFDLFVQNNSSEEYTDFGISFRDKKDAFAEAEFILTDACGEAYITEKGSVTNLYLAPGETKALQFEGTLNDDLDVLDRKEIAFFCGGYDGNEEAVTVTTEFPFTIGLFNELSIDFTDGTELIPDENNTLEITIGFNDIGYYYDTEVATDSNAKVATDSDTELATDSDADVATDSNADIDEDYVFDLTNVTLNLETVGVKFENVKLADASIDEQNGTITAQVSYKVDEDAEAGEYFGTVTANVKNGKKVYQAQTGFQVEVEEASYSTFKKSGLFTAELENFTVNVEVAKGAFDEKVELSVTELAENSEAFKTAEAAMENHDREYDGMMALDICFLNEAGEEVEPNEGHSVQVSIEMKAEVLPEGIDTESLMVHHIAETTTDDVQAEVELVVEDVADTADATAGIVEVKEDAEEAVVAAEFSVDRFSTFTITWNTGIEVIVNYITDTNVDLTGVQSLTVIANNSFDLKKFALSSYVVKKENNTLETYSFNKAELIYGSKKYEYSQVENNAIEWSDENNALQYYDSVNNTWNDITVNSTLNLVYDKVQKGNTFKGEDTKDLINIYLKDFGINDHEKEFRINKNTDDSSNYGMNKYTGGSGVYQGIVNGVLDDGYPVLDMNNSTSLKKYFSGDEVKANYLFQIDEKGYYYYDSSYNAAYLDTETGEFGLYSTPHASGNYDSGTEPQFMPYHTMGSTEQNDENYPYFPYYWANGEMVPSTPEAGTDFWGNTKEEANYFFGMAVDFDFIMPADGEIIIKDPAGNNKKDQNGENLVEDMIFEFNGDDDVWVFIDDVLVLDLGGVHQKNTGRINFSTGTITIDNVAHYAVESDATNPPTIKDMFDRAKEASLEKDPTGEEWNSTKASKIVWNGNIFKDYSQHTLKFFYMERGAGGSNCKLKFNLQTIPEGTINFQKKIGYKNVSDASDINFEFMTYVNYSGDDIVENGEISRKNYSLYKGKYEIYEAKNMNNPIATGVATDGKIYLKDGQVARLVNDPLNTNESKITAKSKFYVHEVGATSEKYNVVIDNVTVTQNDKNLEGAVTENLIVGSNPHIVFENNVQDTNKFNVIIKKEISDGTTPNTEFKFNLLLGNNETLYEGKYDVYERDYDNTWIKRTEDAIGGIIKIKAGQYAEVIGLVGGNTVKVQEINFDGKVYNAPTYAIVGPLASSNIKQGEYAQGTALEGNALFAGDNGGVVTVSVTNNKKVTYTSLTISKEVTGNLGDWSKPFTFTVTAANMPDGTTLPAVGSDFVSGNGYTYVKKSDVTATITLTHNANITLSQVPVGATITVAEEDYSAEKYETEYAVNNGSAKKGSTASVTLAKTASTIKFINDKKADIDTGISMDTLPYILIMLAVIGGIAFTVIRKRKDDELD